MKLTFIGPATLAKDGGIDYPSLLDDKPLLCHFSYEVLEDIDTEAIQGDAMELFNRHQFSLLSLAEQKVINGVVMDKEIHIYSNDLSAG
jgi:hypothetical protein